MLETSKDLLFISLSFCALLFTGFICIMLYQFISITSNVRGIADSIKQKLDMLDDVLRTLKEKIKSSANYIAIIVSGIEKIIKHMQDKKSENRSRANTKKQK